MIYKIRNWKRYFIYTTDKLHHTMIKSFKQDSLNLPSIISLTKKQTTFHAIH